MLSLELVLASLEDFRLTLDRPRLKIFHQCLDFSGLRLEDLDGELQRSNSPASDSVSEVANSLTHMDSGTSSLFSLNCFKRSRKSAADFLPSSLAKSCHDIEDDSEGLECLLLVLVPNITVRELLFARRKRQNCTFIKRQNVINLISGRDKKLFDSKWLPL